MADRPLTVIVGAGPAGLTAAHQLVKRGQRAILFEAEDLVGGLSRTVERDGWRFDIGGHRFFTKVRCVDELWQEILSDEEFPWRSRRSRILYRGKFFDYPLKPLSALRSLGPWEATRCIASYLAAQASPPSDQSQLEGWLTARFGRRLYSIFFKTYTEKVWGVPASSIQAAWAAQRIKNLSLIKAVADALFPRRSRTAVTSLIREFRYPLYGPGMMWERCRNHIETLGGTIRTGTAVTTVHRDPSHARATGVTVTGHHGTAEYYRTEHVISSMPLPDLIHAMDPPAPEPVAAAARQLRYRDFLTVALIVPAKFSFPDNWIYIHTPGVSVGRVQNFGAWSPHMVKDGWTCLGLEYFVHQDDGLWAASDAELVMMATAELEQLDLVPPGAVDQGYVVRMPKAYPLYDHGYQQNVETIRTWLSSVATNVLSVGRNGMHRYNNMDHSMLTAMLAVEKAYDGKDHDLWSVNVEHDYHEETTGSHGTGRAAPILPRQATPCSCAGCAG